MHTYTSFLDSDVFSKQYKRNWARLIRKIYETDPLCCPSCSGKMKVISIIERPDVVKKILQHLGLWDGKPRPPPKTGVMETAVDASDSQLFYREDYFYRDPEYPIEVYAS